MALELNKLTHAVDDLGANAAQRLRDVEEKRPMARAALDAIGLAGDELQARVQSVLRFRWAGAIPTTEPVNAAFPLPSHPDRLTVIAADGSQIYPDRHGVALYYLINVGSIVFQHGQPAAPATSSRPQVYFEDADLYEEDGGQIPSAMIDAHRDIAELAELARLAKAAAGPEAPPVVTLLDNGLLLYISLQVPDEKLIQKVLGEYLAQLDQIKAAGALVAGVVDRPRAASVVRLIQLAGLKPEEIAEERLRHLGPLQSINDGMLFDFLRPGERSALFVNASPANLDRYTPRGHTIYFFYLNAGQPGRDALLRVEVPEWVAQDRARLDRVHAALVEQSRVSGGFPYVLMRAHELAVVTVAERREFDQMVAGALMRRGLRVGLSQKAQGKAWTGAGKRRYPR